MSRDFAKKPNSPRSKPKSKPKSSKRKSAAQSSVSVKQYAVTFGVLFAFIGGLYLLHDHNQRHQPQKHVTHAKKKVETKHKKNVRFEFYNVLPSTEVQTSANDPEKAVSEGPAEPTSFILQVATFKHPKQADRLKAELTLQGYDVQIVEIQQRFKWYRVYVGPFEKQITAEKAQSKLRVNHIDSILRSYS